LFLFGWRFFPHFSGGNDRSPTRHISWSSISLYTLPQWSIIVLFSGLHVASELFPYRWPQKLKGLKDPFSLYFSFRSPSLTSWDLYQENNSATPLCELISLSSGWKLSRRKSLAKWGGGGYKNWDP
jgi:hypothetical protein